MSVFVWRSASLPLSFPPPAWPGREVGWVFEVRRPPCFPPVPPCRFRLGCSATAASVGLGPGRLWFGVPSPLSAVCGFHGLRARFVRHSSLWVCALAILPGRSATACPVPVQVGLGSGLFPVVPPHLLLWVCALAVGLVVPPPWSLVGPCSGHWVRSLRHSLAVGLFRVRSFLC